MQALIPVLAVAHIDSLPEAVVWPGMQSARRPIGADRRPFFGAAVRGGALAPRVGVNALCPGAAGHPKRVNSLYRGA